MKISDLGIAKTEKSLHNSETLGTISYMAPEVILKKQQSISVDYYALGVILYEILLGRVFRVSKLILLNHLCI